MADKTINVRFKQRYDTESHWSSSNPVLLAGEMAISSDKNGAYKIGNGTNKWSELSYAKQPLTKTDVTNALGYTPPTTDTKYTHPTYTSRSNGLYKVTVDGTGHVSYATTVTKSDITGLGIPSQDTTYSIGNATTAGITKLYTSTGSSTDGTMTRSAITNELNSKASTSHTHDYVDSYSGGFMSPYDKNKLDGIDSGANYYTHPSYSSKSSGLYKITVDSKGHVSGATSVTKSDITALGIPGSDTNTTYGIGSAYTAGITKLYSGTGNYTDGTMTQYAITDALSDKANVSHTHNYAGSANPGGSAYNAERLSVGTVGSSDQPVYFSNGKPNACQSYESLKNEILLACYPVGAIYMSTSSTNPGSLFGGTWTAWGSGRVPVGINTSDGDFNTVEKTGGAKTVSLTTAQMPAHSHTVNSHNHSIPKLSGTANSAGAHSHTLSFKYNSDTVNNGKVARITAGGSKSTGSASDVYTMGSAGAHTHSVSTNAATSGNSSPGTNSQGSGSAHNNMQPYIVCYMWKRTK